MKLALTSFLPFDNFGIDEGSEGRWKVVSNMLGIILALVVILVGLILLITWWGMFIKGLMAVVPILLLLIGVGALIYFISEIKSKLGMSEEESSTSGEKKPE